MTLPGRPPATKAVAKAAPKASRTRSMGLAGLLFALVAAYFLLRPTLNWMLADADRMNREADRHTLNAALKVGADADAQKAVLNARNQVAARPDDVTARLTLAEMLMASGQTAEAVSVAQEARRRMPDGIAPSLVLADIYQRAKQYDNAIQAYRQTLQRSPNNPRAVAGLSVIYLALGWTQDAETLLKNAIAAQPGERPLKVALALTCIQHSEYQQAETILTELRKQDPSDGTLWGPLSDVYLKMWRPQQALAVLQEAGERFPDDGRVLDALIQAQFQSGDMKAVEQTAKTGLVRSPNDIALHYYLGLSYQLSNRPDDALRELESVLRENPNYENLRLVLGPLYRQKGRAAEADRLLAEQRQIAATGERRSRTNLRVSMKPNDPDAHFEMAKVYQAEKNDDRLRIELRRTLELAPQHDGAKRLWAEIGGEGDNAPR